jgi:glutathione S-transferase
MLKGKKTVFKLYYFETNFRAQIIRALLNWSKVDWEDIKLTKEEFKDMKEKGIFNETFQQLPILEYKNNMFSQSHSIEIYLAKKFRLLGLSIEEEFEILTIIFLISDLSSKLISILVPSNKEEEDNQIENLKSFTAEFLPTALKSLENTLIRLNENDEGNNYFIGKKLSLADFAFGTFYYQLFFHPLRKDLLLPIGREHSPKLMRYIENLVDKEFKEYYEKVHINLSPF